MLADVKANLTFYPTRCEPGHVGIIEVCLLE